MNKTNLKIENAAIDDCALIYQFIIKLAKAEEFPFDVLVTLEDLQVNLFGDSSVAECLLFFIDDKPIGFAVYYFTFSTCVGKNGLHLEDLYIEPEYHGNGFGKQIMQYLAELAVAKKCARFEWWVVNSNLPAIQFYKKLGAKQLNELSIFRLTGTELDNLV